VGKRFALNKLRLLVCDGLASRFCLDLSDWSGYTEGFSRTTERKALGGEQRDARNPSKTLHTLLVSCVMGFERGKKSLLLMFHRKESKRGYGNVSRGWGRAIESGGGTTGGEGERNEKGLFLLGSCCCCCRVQSLSGEENVDLEVFRLSSFSFGQRAIFFSLSERGRKSVGDGKDAIRSSSLACCWWCCLVGVKGETTLCLCHE
jgi:hypothetical protein